MIFIIHLVNVICDRKLFSILGRIAAKDDNDCTFPLALDYIVDNYRVQSFEHVRLATSADMDSIQSFAEWSEACGWLLTCKLVLV